MKRLLFCLSLILTLSSQIPTFAKSPIEIATVSSIEELAGEVDSKVKEIEELVATGKFEDKDKVAIRQAAGVLACLGQAIQEHSGNQATKIQGAALRDHAFTIVKACKSGTLDDVKKNWPEVKTAIAGACKDEHKPEHEWNKLISMHDMMEEVNGRNSKLRRLLKRNKGTLEEQQHAATLAILAVAMAVDTHEVKDKTKIPEWEKMSFDYQKAMSELSLAIKAQDKTKMEAAFNAGNKACDLCHEVFREEE